MCDGERLHRDLLSDDLDEDRLAGGDTISGCVRAETGISAVVKRRDLRDLELLLLSVTSGMVVRGDEGRANGTGSVLRLIEIPTSTRPLTRCRLEKTESLPKVILDVSKGGS
jgi:hypothetical protein